MEYIKVPAPWPAASLSRIVILVTHALKLRSVIAGRTLARQPRGGLLRSSATSPRHLQRRILFLAGRDTTRGLHGGSASRGSELACGQRRQSGKWAEKGAAWHDERWGGGSSLESRGEHGQTPQGPVNWKLGPSQTGSFSCYPDMAIHWARNGAARHLDAALWRLRWHLHDARGLRRLATCHEQRRGSSAGPGPGHTRRVRCGERPTNLCGAASSHANESRVLASR